MCSTLWCFVLHYTACSITLEAKEITRSAILSYDLLAAQFSYTPDRKLHILDRLAWSEMFESFLANKFAAAKRFGLEGCETLIPGMKALIDRSTDLGVDSIVMGMPHRGAAPF
jgi:2-oxoglutarate dehydrogenase complex dehydrogenase (E1) component-like enzyme